MDKKECWKFSLTCSTFVTHVEGRISHPALLIFSLNHFHPTPSTTTYPNPSQQGTDIWSGKKRQQHRGPLDSAFLLSHPLALLVIHSWEILGGSYVNVWVCFWLGGTKSTLYKGTTLKQLPLLPTAAMTQTSDCAAAWLVYSGGKDGCRPFTVMCFAISAVWL